jgi:hypothetical protein
MIQKIKISITKLLLPPSFAMYVLSCKVGKEYQRPELELARNSLMLLAILIPVVCRHRMEEIFYEF